MAQRTAKKKRKVAKKSVKRKPKLSNVRKPENMSLEEWQIQLRREYGIAQNFKMENHGEHPFFSDFAVSNPESGRTYRVLIRGREPGMNHCSCPDFAVNTLGTCKHIEFAVDRLLRKRGAKTAFKQGYRPVNSEVWLRTGARHSIVLSLGEGADEQLTDLAEIYFDEGGTLRQEAFATFPAFLRAAQALGHEIRCMDSALNFLAKVRDDQNRQKLLAQKYPHADSLQGLLHTTLHPYQAEGVLFAARAGRVLLGDEMGLGKTIQAIAVAELLAREVGIERVLIVCPASLKHQWKGEIERFTDRTALTIEGSAEERAALYPDDAFFKIVNYDVVHRDLDAIKQQAFDLIILDEAQRIKNWRTRTAKSVNSLESTYAIVLTGTPLENRLEELHSLVSFVDRHRLGPLFRFLHRHRVVEGETNKVVGYRDLKSIGDTLAPILLRRKKADVLHQLPERTDKNYFVPMTPRQKAHHAENHEIVARMASKWRHHGFLSEGDQRRLRIALQRMRMACDDAYLVDQERRSGTKVEELVTLLEEVFENSETGVVVFSQWKRMHELVEKALQAKGIGYVFLHGGVPTPKRQDLIQRFQQDPEVKVFLSTDAGGVGLNLQAGSVVINLDLPWNPAVLEQRIARVHRMGQTRNVQVINLVSEGTIEHGMLSVLRFKSGLAAGALDGGEDEVFLEGGSLKRFMDTLEEASDAIPETKADEVEPEPVQETARERSPRKSEAKSKPRPARQPSASLAPLLQSGASFLKELGAYLQNSRAEQPASRFVETDQESGRSYLKIPLPEKDALQSLVQAAGPVLQLLGGLADGEQSQE